MPIYQRLINFDTLRMQLREPPIIINDLLVASKEEREHIRDLIQVKYSSDLLSILPTCQCRALKGEHAIGQTCEFCHRKVQPAITEEIEPLVWFRAPEGTVALINPMVWIMLRNRLKKSGFSVLDWLCDTTYHSVVKKPQVVTELLDQGVKRGYNHFVTQFHEMIPMLFSMKAFRLKKGKKDYLLQLLDDYNDCIFSQFIPLPNRTLMIIEKTNVGTYLDLNNIKAWDAIWSVSGIDSPTSTHSQRIKENRTAKMLSKLADYYYDYHKTMLSGKNGIMRKNIFGTRAHFSFRAVITSITRPHQHNEIYIPWGVGITVFRHHLLNKLIRLGYERNKAIGFIHGHVEQYDETGLLSQLFHELITETPYVGIPCIIQRNPSMMQASAQLVYITQVKNDPKDHTVSMSILIVRGMNADFDGKLIIAIVKLF